MGKNINKRTNPLFFVDLDGTIVEHNYDPENTMEKIIPCSINVLRSLTNYGVELCLTTARSKEHTEQILYVLENYHDLPFKYCLTDLPSGSRYLVNDFVTNKKAFAINVKRNEGLRGVPYGVF